MFRMEQKCSWLVVTTWSNAGIWCPLSAFRYHYSYPSNIPCTLLTNSNLYLNLGCCPWRTNQNMPLGQGFQFQLFDDWFLGQNCTLFTRSNPQFKRSYWITVANLTGKALGSASSATGDHSSVAWTRLLCRCRITIRSGLNSWTSTDFLSFRNQSTTAKNAFLFTPVRVSMHLHFQRQKRGPFWLCCGKYWRLLCYSVLQPQRH